MIVTINYLRLNHKFKSAFMKILIDKQKEKTFVSSKKKKYIRIFSWIILFPLLIKKKKKEERVNFVFEKN